MSSALKTVNAAQLNSPQHLHPLVLTAGWKWAYICI